MRSHQSDQGVGLWGQRAKKSWLVAGCNQYGGKVLYVDAIDEGGAIFHVDPHESHAQTLRNLGNVSRYSRQDEHHSAQRHATMNRADALFRQRGLACNQVPRERGGGRVMDRSVKTSTSIADCATHASPRANACIADARAQQRLTIAPSRVRFRPAFFAAECLRRGTTPAAVFVVRFVEGLEEASF
jgi:hypothetical protein